MHMREFHLFCISAAAYVVLAAASGWTRARESDGEEVSWIMAACSPELELDSARAGPLGYRRAFWRAQIPYWLRESPETLRRYAGAERALGHEAVQACLARQVLRLRSERAP